MLYINRPAIRGFTLIEILITVIIVGILAAISLPSFQDSIYTARRGEAKSDLLNLAQAQAKWRLKNPTYTANLSNLVATNSGYYTFIVFTNAAATFTITATPNSNQAGDVCGELQINQDVVLTSVNDSIACPKP